jgi:hypothetical protein
MVGVETNRTRLVQFKTEAGERKVAVVGADGETLLPLVGYSTVHELALASIETGVGLEALVASLPREPALDYDAVLKAGRVLPPLDHPEPARFLITGTGLTHTGSATARNRMHLATHGPEAHESDSMKIYRMGLDGGKPAEGAIGIQPEWFFKGVGTCVVPPGAPLELPGYALAGAEEAEIVGLYIVDGEGRPRRIGYALGNDFSDHITEGKNYLYLAHSKLRDCSIGPELLLGELPQEVRGTTRIVRDGKIVWEEEFLSGESHMSHSIGNLEHYHFRYPMFRRPGDLHAYFFGADAMSYASNMKTEANDEFEIVSPTFGKALRNRMVAGSEEKLVSVTPL